ncbi:MAG: hypothetical protein LBU30_00645 [Candidatus Methanoplasma sp.]|jgi:hypothetical protein|nr:hypothetical protein [Candidatus Methanoplasma sp.]
MANTAIPYDTSHLDLVSSILELKILLGIIVALIMLYGIYKFIVDSAKKDESPENIINEPIKKERTPAQQEYYDMFGKDWDEE